MVVSAFIFVVLIRYTWIEDEFNSLLNKPHDMAMCKLGRITL